MNFFEKIKNYFFPKYEHEVIFDIWPVSKFYDGVEALAKNGLVDFKHEPGNGIIILRFKTKEDAIKAKLML